jgi:hypothetical protein
MGDRRYNTQKTVEDEEKELDDLIQQQKEDAEVAERQAKAEAEEFHEPDSADERTFKKRYGDLRRHSQKQQKTNEEKIGVLQEQLDVATKTQIKLPKSEAELEVWSKEYPDVAAIIETIAIKKSKEQAQDLEKQMDEINKLQSSARREKAEAELLTIHPDFTAIRGQDDFHTWAEEQPKWVQDALYENETDARAAARAIDLYKSDRGFEPSSKKQGKKATSSKDAARFVDTKSARSLPETSGRKSKWSESKVDQMNAIEYEKHSDEIREAIQDGDFLYDMSGAAR